MAALAAVMVSLFTSLLQAYQLPPQAESTSGAPSTSLGGAHTFFQTYSFRIPDDAFPLELVFVGPVVDEMNPDEVAEAVEIAVRAWNDVACSYAEFRWAGFVDSFDDVGAGQVPIWFDFSPGVFESLYAWTPLPGSNETPPEGLEVIVNGATYRWSLEPRPFQFLPHKPSPERPTADLPSIVTHELGHVLGLAHTEAHGAATMVATYLGDGHQRELSAVDKLGACHLYPTEADECSTDADCPPGAACISGEQGSVCDIYLGEVGDYCGVELIHCRGLCHIDDPPTGTGYCSRPCGSHDQCPEHFSCLDMSVDADNPERICRFDPDLTEDTTSGGCAVAQGAPPKTPLALLILATAVAAIRTRRANPTGPAIGIYH